MKTNYFLNSKFLVTMTMLLFVFVVSAQQIQIKGKVIDDKNTPLPSASLLIKGTKNGTTTDLNGAFIFQAKKGDVILVTFIGYGESQFTVTDKKEYTIALKELSSTLDEVFVVGYTKEKKSDMSGAITVVKVSDVAGEPSPNILTALQGRVAGIQINSGGTPGGNDSQIAIRGVNTVTSSSSPLWVIDGVQTFNSSSLNPEEIESIQVLKDGASAAIYGTSAANGVIVVTTKKGKKGISEFNFRSEVTSNFIRDKIDLLNSQQWADVTYQAQLGAGIAVPTHPILINNGSGFTIPQYLDSNHIQTAANTNWVKTITQNSVSSNIGFGYRKGNEKYNIYTDVNYAKDNGIQRYTYYDRMNMRLNASYNILKDKLTIGENFLYSNFNEVKANEFENAILQNPLIPVYTNLGDYAAPLGGGLQDKPNSLANLWSNRNNKQKNQRFLGNIYADLKIVKNLTFNTTLNFDFGLFKFDTASEAFSVNGTVPSVFQNLLTTSNRNNDNKTIFTNSLKYEIVKNKHRISLFAGIENYRFRSNLNTNIINGVDATNGYSVNSNAQFSTKTGKIEEFKISQFGSVKYIYDDKYIFSGSIRRDGSSRFGENNKYGIFPAASLAWNVKKEDFLKNKNAISNLKLRVSWGVNGNDQFPSYYPSLASYIDHTSGNVIEFSDYNISGSGYGTNGGILSSRQANPDLKWEKTEQINSGFDVSFLKNRLELQTDFYTKTTRDLILQPIAIAINGESTPPYVNAGSVSNKGFESVLSYKSKSSNAFTYGVDVNFSKYKNNVESLDTDANFILNGPNITQKGSPIGSFYGLIADGIFRTPEEVAVHADQPGKAVGRLRYRDINGDGVINEKDRTIIGSPHPDFSYGINLNAAYKGFDINIFFDGKQGNKIYNTQRYLGDFAYFGFNYGANTLDSWSPSNANSNIPALSTLNTNNELQASSYYVEDGSYFRLKSITLGYNLNKKIAKTIGFSKLRFYASGQNLFRITSFTGFDYEVPGIGTSMGVAGYGIPHAKSVSFGINANF